MVPSENIKFMRYACLLCDKSACNYKVGCMAVLNGKILVESFNETLPGEKYCQNGECIREKLNLSGGEQIEKVCTSHAEIGLLAKAARRGVSLEGCDVYVTTFPCYVCSKALVQAGIGRLFYMSDYGNNDGMRFFRAAEIPVVQIEEEDVWKK